MGDAVKVAIRVRPFNQREKDLQSKLVVRMQGQTTFLMNPETGKERPFAFDYSFWSNNAADPHFVTQEAVFRDVGEWVLDNAFQGYNCTILAYGQTGSGKSFTMVGGENNESMYKDQQDDSSRGVIPRLCHGIFDRVKKKTTENVTFQIEASMMEIYNERIHDLLNPEHCKGHNASTPELRIRESPTMGPYVEGLTMSAVSSFDDLSLLMSTGTRHRTIGATSMNHNSSRAHTIVTIVLTQTTVDKERLKAMDKVSRINLVDLAGSERQGKTEATGDRLKEGCAINKSLSALGKCITMIATGGEMPDDLASSSYSSLQDDDILNKTFEKNDPRGKRNKDKFIPYRDSVLTWLLSESLGGNAKTLMIAAISPAEFNYAETLSTLRYAWQAKQIKNKAVVNEDPNERLIRELKEEIMALRRKLGGDASVRDDVDGKHIQEQLKHSEEMITNLNKTWEQRLKETEMQLRGGSSVLQPMGGAVAVESMEPEVPFLLNLHEDQTLSKNLAYPIHRYSVFGSQPSEKLPSEFEKVGNSHILALTLAGVGILPEHCVLENVGFQLFITPVSNSRVCVNGIALKPRERKALQHNDRILMGMSHAFVVAHPHHLESLTPRQGTSADWASAMEEVLAAIHQKFFDPNEQNKKLEELNATMEEARQRQRKLEQERDMYRQKLQEIELEQEQVARRKEANIQTKVKELEIRLKREGKAVNFEEEKALLIAQLEAQDAEGEDKLEMRKQMFVSKQFEIEEKMHKQEEKTKVFKLRKEKERREVARAEEHIMQLIPVVDEANLMSDEMNRQVKFEVRLQTSVSPEIYEDPLSGETIHKTHVEAGVCVLHLDSNQSCMWDYDKFMTRIYLMREQYELFMASPNDYRVSEMNDPFFDKSEAVEVGKGHLWLMGLSHLIDTEDTIPLISKLGDNQGKVVMAVILADPKGRPASGQYDHADHVTKLVNSRIDLLVRVDAVKGLDSSKFSDIHARFKFFDDDNTTQTRSGIIEDGTAIIGYSRHVTIPKVTADFVSFLQADALTVEVWGTPILTAAPVASPGTSTSRSSASHSEASSRTTRTATIATSVISNQTTAPVVSPAARAQPAATRAKSMGLGMRSKLDPIEDEDKVKVKAKPQEITVELNVLTQQLQESESEKKVLIVKVEQLSTATNLIPVLESRIVDLELENQRLRAQMESSNRHQRATSEPKKQNSLDLPGYSVGQYNNHQPRSGTSPRTPGALRASTGAVRSARAQTTTTPTQQRSSTSKAPDIATITAARSPVYNAGQRKSLGGMSTASTGSTLSTTTTASSTSHHGVNGGGTTTAKYHTITTTTTTTSNGKAAPVSSQSHKDRLEEMRKRFGN